MRSRLRRVTAAGPPQSPGTGRGGRAAGGDSAVFGAAESSSSSPTRLLRNRHGCEPPVFLSTTGQPRDAQQQMRAGPERAPSASSWHTPEADRRQRSPHWRQQLTHGMGAPSQRLEVSGLGLRQVVGSSCVGDPPGTSVLAVSPPWAVQGQGGAWSQVRRHLALSPQLDPFQREFPAGRLVNLH